LNVAPTTLSAKQNTQYLIGPEQQQRLSVGVEVTLPEPTGGEFGFEFGASMELPPNVEDVIWDKTKKALLEALEVSEGVPAGGLLVKVSLELSPPWKWTPGHERSLPTFVASMAAASLKAILSVRALRETK
jgi:hypothetical protein